MLRNLTHRDLIGLDPDKLWMFQVENEEQGGQLLDALKNLQDQHPRLEKLAGIIVPKDITVVQTDSDKLTIIRGVTGASSDAIAKTIEQVAERNPRFNINETLVIPDDASIEQRSTEWLEAYVRGLQDLLEKRRSSHDTSSKDA